MQRIWLTVVLMLVPAATFAQGAFAPLDADLAVGQKVRVIVDVACPSEACVRKPVAGKITELSAASIVVDDGRVRHELPALDIQRVERPRDRIWNGALTGFGVGFSAGFITVMADDCAAGQWCIFEGPSFAAGFGLVTGAIGAGIGAMTDALISKPRLVFDRAGGSSRTTITPLVGPRSGGIRVSVQF